MAFNTICQAFDNININGEIILPDQLGITRALLHGYIDQHEQFFASEELLEKIYSFENKTRNATFVELLKVC